MDGLTINQAAETTGWSPRMLRYIETEGLIEPHRSPAGYRLYGPEQLQRLRTLRELLAEHEMTLGDAGFAMRMRREPDVGQAVADWLEARPSKPEGVDASEWLRFEQEKHQRLLADATEPTPA